MKNERTLLVGDAVIEFPSHFSMKDVDSFMTKRGNRRDGLHVYVGKDLTEKLEAYCVRKQLRNMGLL